MDRHRTEAFGSHGYAALILVVKVDGPVAMETFLWQRTDAVCVCGMIDSCCCFDFLFLEPASSSASQSPATPTVCLPQLCPVSSLPSSLSPSLFLMERNKELLLSMVRFFLSVVNHPLLLLLRHFI